MRSRGREKKKKKKGKRKNRISYKKLKDTSLALVPLSWLAVRYNLANFKVYRICNEPLMAIN